MANTPPGPRKVKLRLGGRPLRGKQLFIPVIRTAILATPPAAGTPDYVRRPSRKKKRKFAQPKNRHAVARQLYPKAIRRYVI